MIYTKVDFKESKYLELPKGITSFINKEDYQSSYKANNIYIIKLRIRNQTNFKSLEIEYDIKEDIFLTRDERKLKVPKDRELIFIEYGIKILVQYYLEEKTDSLKEVYQMYSLDTIEKLEDSNQDYFSMKRNFKDKAKEVYEREKKKEIYQKYTDEEKALYWAGHIEEWEHKIGAFDIPPIDFIDSSGLNGLRKKEPNIDKLMPLILKKLAIWWEYDIDFFFKRVNDNLSMNYKK